MIGRLGGAGRLVLLAAAAVLGGCDSLSEALGFSDDNALEIGPTCPRVAVGDDVGYVARFDGNGSKSENLLYAVKMNVPNGVCFLNDTTIDVEMTVPILVERGPAMDGRDVNFEYWVAVARTDKTIVAREAYQTGAELRLNEVGQIVEEFDQTIPIQPGETGRNFVIIVGLVLTEEELDYNRQPKIFGRPVPEGEIKVREP
jgi:hypothetical protein